MRTNAKSACAMVLGAALLGGCQHETVETNVWVRGAKPTFATIDRASLYALTPAAQQDVVAIERDTTYDRATYQRETWLLSIPSDARVGTTLEFGVEPMYGARGWLVEHVSRGEPRSADLSGTATIVARTNETIVVDVDLHAVVRSAFAGELGDPRLALAGRFEAMRRTPITPVTPELETRSGVAAR